MLMNQPLPDRILNAPKLNFGLQLYLSAFFDLDSERSHSMGVVSIPNSEIRNYAGHYDFSDDQTEDLLYVIRQMDNAHTKRMADKLKSKN